jgi:hypothetical protein
LARGFAFMLQLGLYSIACESIFYVILQEANKHIFYVVLLYSKGASNGHDLHVCIARTRAICNCRLQEATITTIVFFIFYCNERATATIFFTSHCKGASNYNKKSNNALGVRAGCKGMMTMQQSNIICRIAKSNDIITFFII